MAGEVEAAHMGHMAHQHPGSPWGRLSPHPAASETEGGRKGNPDARGPGSQASDRHGHRESSCVSAGCTATPSCCHCKPTDTQGASVDVSRVVHICLLQELCHTWERGSEVRLSHVGPDVGRPEADKHRISEQNLGSGELVPWDPPCGSWAAGPPQPLRRHSPACRENGCRGDVNRRPGLGEPRPGAQRPRSEGGRAEPGELGNQLIVKGVNQILVTGQMGVDGVLRRCFSGAVTLELRLESALASGKLLSVSASSFARMSKVLPPVVSKGISFNRPGLPSACAGPELDEMLQAAGRRVAGGVGKDLAGMEHGGEWALGLFLVRMCLGATGHGSLETLGKAWPWHRGQRMPGGTLAWQSGRQCQSGPQAPQSGLAGAGLQDPSAEPLPGDVACSWSRISGDPRGGGAWGPSLERRVYFPCSRFAARLPLGLWCQRTREQRAGALHVFRCSPWKPWEARSQRAGWVGIKGLGPVASVKNGPALPLGAKGGVPKGTHKTPSVRQAQKSPESMDNSSSSVIEEKKKHAKKTKDSFLGGLCAFSCLVVGHPVTCGFRCDSLTLRRTSHQPFTRQFLLPVMLALN
ncbi:hypothetical protein J1605_006400 [Eschrichtius robustus]|uniref:Uncharacterized protein n=1 Tax=Eschrichtius robustus TaxID=9764 RepID=A0AB34H668_ESCRO|nr:hypothetical protein J1605_006400 [Eschrichtius robustus]